MYVGEDLFHHPYLKLLLYLFQWYYTKGDCGCLTKLSIIFK